ncbi:hypothetical protein D3C78_1527570 [compost metagenome]
MGQVVALAREQAEFRVAVVVGEQFDGTAQSAIPSEPAGFLEGRQGFLQDMGFESEEERIVQIITNRMCGSLAVHCRALLVDEAVGIDAGIAA